MRGQASNSTGRSGEETRAAARRRPGAVGLLAVGLLLGSAGPALAANQGDLILNEFNAVADSRFLKGRGGNFIDAYVFVDDDEIQIASHSFEDEQGPYRLTTTGTLPEGLSLDTDYYVVWLTADRFGLSLTPGGAMVDITDASGGGTHTMKLPDEEGDSFFGVVQGNGGNWLEFVVIADHLDIRGWTLEWYNDDDSPACNAGTVTFEDLDIWSDLRSGTIITVAEELSDDLSYDPARGDWWINANHEEAAASHTPCFKVDNDDWRMRIWDGPVTCESNPSPPPPLLCTGVGATAVIQTWVGEGSELWGGGGIGDNEVGKLEGDPSRAAASYPPLPPYNDGSSSTFSSENLWGAGTMKQDFSELRPFILSVPALTGAGLGALVGVIVASALWVTRRRASAG